MTVADTAKRRRVADLVYVWGPQWHWHGWRTLIPFFMGEDPDGKRTAVFGWTVTGRVIVRLWTCRDPECAALRAEFAVQDEDGA